MFSNSVKKIYSFTNNREIWRLLPSNSGYLVIEERDSITKEVFFNCIKTNDGEILFTNMQLDEKQWIGIESVYNSIVFFHKYRKPDMPSHKGIFAFDILKKKMIWSNEDLVFQFAKDDRVFAFRDAFDGRNYYSLNILDGSIVDNMGDNFHLFHQLSEDEMKTDFAKSFKYCERFVPGNTDTETEIHLTSLFTKKEAAGDVNFLKASEYILLSYHLQNSDGTFDNHFEIFDNQKQKVVLNKTLNKRTAKFIPESFFMMNDLLFLLIEKTKLVVYRIKQ